MSEQWKAVYSSYGDELWFGGNDGPGMWEIEGAEAYLPGDHDTQARLIAAAPDLLAALEKVQDWLEGCSTIETVRKEVAAALAKAKGETQ